MLALTTILLLFNTYAFHYNETAAISAETLPKIENNNVIIENGKEESPKKILKNRKVVNLNMKQGLIMNQAISVYALTTSPNELCRNQSLAYQRSLRAFEPWALQMFDSSSKLQSGILAGNLMEFGSFKQCINIYTQTEYGPITGKHCVVRVEPTTELIQKILSFRNVTEKRFERIKNSLKGASLHWSVCIPDSCTHEDVDLHFNRAIPSVTEGLKIDVSVSELDCYATNEESDLSNREKGVLTFIAIILGFICLCTIMDVWKRRRNENRSKLVEIFSAYSNVVYITTYKQEAEGLDCLNGIRFLSICYVIFGHKYLMTLFFPSVNSLDVFDWYLKYPSTIIIGGTVSVDTFFLLSGLLVSYHFFGHMSKGGKFNLGLFYLHRYIRLTPSYGMVILFIVTLGHRLGSGPLWKKVILSVQKPCQYFWWSALMYTQSYTNPRYTCILQTWYLTCDMQFYIFSPVLLYPLWKWKIFGIVNFVSFYIGSVAINFYLVWKNKYRVGLLMDNNVTQSDFFAYHYIMPYVRASPYILGVGFGYALHKTRNQKPKMGTLALTSGWLISAALLATVILSNHLFEIEEHEYNRLEACLYLAMTRSAWVLGVMWIIWACRCGQGGPINTLLSAHLFQILGRITYSVFLVHMPIQILSLGATKQPLYFSNIKTIQNAFGDIAFSLIVAFLLTIFIEYPFVRCSLLFFRKGNGRRIDVKNINDRIIVSRKK